MSCLVKCTFSAVRCAAVVAVCLTPSRALAAPDGWGAWKFGQTLEQALAVSKNLYWNDYSLRECKERIELEGCLLSTYEGPSLPAIDAISLRPLLNFNRHGSLEGISLIYEREGRVTQAQCLDIYGRLADWQIGVLGQFSSDDRPPDEKDVKAGWSRSFGLSENGFRYTYGQPRDKSAYITSVIRWIPSVGRVENVEVSIFSSFIMVNQKPHCHVTVKYERDL